MYKRGSPKNAIKERLKLKALSLRLQEALKLKLTASGFRRPWGYKRGSPKNAIKENEGASKGTPFEALIDHGIDRLLVRDLIKNCPLQFLHFQSSESLSLKL